MVSRRGLIKGLIAAGALGTTGLHALIVRAVRAQTAGQGVIQTQGTLLINAVPAGLGTAVGSGDIITTGVSGGAVFVFGEDAFLVRGGSEIVLDDMEPGAAEKFFTVVTGAILSVFGPRPNAVTLDTPLATIGIRGTGIYIESRPNRTYVCTCFGTSNIISKVQPGVEETVRTTHHEAPRYLFAPGQGPGIQSAPVFDHTDDEVTMLEALVGRTPPEEWQDLKPEDRY